METAVIGAVLRVTLPWLRDQAIQQVSQKWRRDLKADVQSIISELDYINAIIKGYRMASQEEDMSDLRMIWIQHLRNLAYEIEDCADNFFMNNIDDKDLARKISELKKRAEEIPNQLHRYESQRQNRRHVAASSSSSHVQGLPDTPAVPPSEGGVGTEETSCELKALLRESQDQKLRVIFIVGFGGMGKTFLADHVYRVESHRFPRKAFVRAAGKDPNTVLEEILQKLQLQEVEQVGNKALEETPMKFNQQQETHRILRFLYYCIQIFAVLMLLCKNMWGKLTRHSWAKNSADVQRSETNGNVNQDDDANVLTAPLKSCLGTNRYLVVIDDARSQELVSYVISGLVQTKQVDSRIIITTTEHKVAGDIFGAVHRRHVYKMRPLDEKNSEELFRKVTFRGRSSSVSDGDTSDTCCGDESSSLVFRQYCDGVPLAVISLANYCAGDPKKCEEAWRKLCNHEEDGRLATMQRVLDDNFNSLSLSGPSSLQDCLLYICMFPRGHDIRRGPLMRRWQAEGLALEQGRNGIVPSADVPLHNLSTLIDRNMLWPLQTSLDSQVKTCQPPGMMLGYITSRSKAENFLNLSCGDGHGTTASHKDIRRLSLYGTGDSDSVRVLSLQHDLPRLRTLAVFYEGKSLKHPLSFAKCKLLRVLDLEACPCNLGRRDEWSKICMLKLLKYLSLGAGIDRVPGKIRELKLLETLQVPKSSVVTVPADVLTLPRLKHLLGKLKLRVSSRNPKKIPDILEHKCKIEKLAGFVTDDDKTKGFPLLMRHMNMLRKVKVWYDSTASEDNIKDLSESINSFLLKAQRTPAISHALSVDFHECTKEPFQNSLIAAGSLSSLKLRGSLPKIPDFVTNLSGIAELCLCSTTLNWQVIVDGVRSLDALKYLKLVADTKIEGAIVVNKAQFKSLKRLCIVAEQIESQIKIKPNALERLVSLHLIIPGLDRRSAKQIRRLGILEDVALHSGVPQKIWKKAARGHPNRPNVMFINRL